MELSDEETKAIETLKEVASDDFDTLGDDISPKMAQNILNVIDKQQKEIEDWFEIADNILRATNDYGNITIGDIPKYIENQQKEIKKEKSRIMELDELLDKQENEIKFLKGELEIQEGCSISKDKIRELKEKVEKEMISNPYDFSYMINKLLEEK